jgi:osmotically-inducible protein OsmY
MSRRGLPLRRGLKARTDEPRTQQRAYQDWKRYHEWQISAQLPVASYNGRTGLSGEHGKYKTSSQAKDNQLYFQDETI